MKKQVVHLANGGSAYQVGEEEMTKLARLSAHFGGASRASVLRMSVNAFYAQTESAMSEKTKKIKG